MTMSMVVGSALTINLHEMNVAWDETEKSFYVLRDSIATNWPKRTVWPPNLIVKNEKTNITRMFEFVTLTNGLLHYENKRSGYRLFIDSEVKKQ